ncbi:MAG: DNA-binding protein [Ignavibacteria bacterium]|nr:DNA-binding protein [Ignavibacteria bacterium]
MNIKTYISKIKEFLNKPFPFEYSIEYNIIYSVFFGVFVAAFLIIFRPFGINEEELTLKLFIILSGYGAITSVILFSSSFLLNKMFLINHNESEWKVKYEICFTILIILLIAAGNSIYNLLTEGYPLTFLHIFGFIYQTFLVGFLPLMISILVVYNRKLKKNLAEARKMNAKLIPQMHERLPEKITISAELVKDYFSLNASAIYFIKSAGNYVEIYYQENSDIKCRLLRTSLKRVEDLCSKFAFIFKCHRTYLVNLDKVKNISGNSQGYLLLFNDDEYSVPVARSLAKELKERLNL